MTYKNPEVSVLECKKFKITVGFTFQQDMTKKEAAEGITRALLKTIESNAGVIPIEWLEHND